MSKSTLNPMFHQSFKIPVALAILLKTTHSCRRRRKESLIKALFSSKFETPYVVSYLINGLRLRCSVSAARPGQRRSRFPLKKPAVLTIEEVVQMALTNNLDILISRLNPVIDQFAMNGLYGAYEPSLSMSAVHNYNDLPAADFSRRPD